MGGAYPRSGKSGEVIHWGHLGGSSEEVSIHTLKGSMNKKKKKTSQLRVSREWWSSYLHKTEACYTADWNRGIKVHC